MVQKYYKYIENRIIICYYFNSCMLISLLDDGRCGMNVEWKDMDRVENCNVCGGRLYYLESGKYLCKTCGNMVEDDTKKLRTYFRNHKESLVFQISKETGVSQQKVCLLLDRIESELLEENSTHIKCEKCGCSIFSGRFCTACTKELAGGIRAVFYEDRKRRMY